MKRVKVRKWLKSLQEQVSELDTEWSAAHAHKNQLVSSLSARVKALEARVHRLQELDVERDAAPARETGSDVLTKVANLHTDRLDEMTVQLNTLRARVGHLEPQEVATDKSADGTFVEDGQRWREVKVPGLVGTLIIREGKLVGLLMGGMDGYMTHRLQTTYSTYNHTNSDASARQLAIHTLLKVRD